MISLKIGQTFLISIYENEDEEEMEEFYEEEFVYD